MCKLASATCRRVAPRRRGRQRETQLYVKLQLDDELHLDVEEHLTLVDVEKKLNVEVQLGASGASNSSSS
jgi:hypothetical protein